MPFEISTPDVGEKPSINPLYKRILSMLDEQQVTPKKDKLTYRNENIISLKNEFNKFEYINDDLYGSKIKRLHDFGVEKHSSPFKDYSSSFKPFPSLGSISTSWQRPNIDYLSDTDSEWAIQIDTSRREHAVKIAAILAKAIDMDTIDENGLSLGVEGGVNTGKTLICDVMAYEFIEAYNAYHAPKRNCMFLESKPDQAYTGPAVSNDFTIAGRSRKLSFKNYGSVSVTSSKEMKKAGQISMTSFNSGLGRINDTTEKCDFSLFIKVSKSGPNIWESTWTIYVAPGHRTEKMKVVLEHLKAVGLRKKVKQEQAPEFSKAA